MKSGETTFRLRLKVTVVLLVVLQLTSTARGAPPRSSLRAASGFCTTPPCVHSASELLDWGKTDVNPCEDFYEFACGNYNNNGFIQSAYSFWNQFRYTQQNVDAMTKEILSEASTCDEPTAVRMAKHVYQACMDEATISQKGTSPLLAVLDTYGGWPVLSRGFVNKGYISSRFSWSDVGRAASQLGIQIIFDILVRPNFFNSSQMITYIQHDSLPTPVPLVSPGQVEPSEILPWDFIPDEADKNISPQPASKDNLYVQYLSRVVRAIWDSRPASELNSFTRQEDVDELVRVELRKVTMLMQKLKAITTYIGSNSNVAKRIMKMGLKSKSGVMTIRTLQNYTDGVFPNPKYKMDWLNFLQNVFGHSNVVLTSDDLLYVESVDKLMKALYIVETTDDRILENFIGSRIVTYLGPESTDVLWKTAKWFYQQLKYITEDYSRWMHCNHVVSNYPSIGLSMAVAYKYRESYFDKEKLDHAKQMISDLQASFRELLEENDWMDDKTRSYALEKVDAMLLLTGFPDWLSDREKLDAFYKNLAVDSFDHLGNLARIRSFEYAQGLKVLREDRDRNVWSQSPLTVNAFYNTLNNRITFPAGVMNRPFFYGTDVEALDYGRIGSIVGHEITHGFDSTGRMFDKYGTFTNWWTPEVESKYKAKAQCFVDQYSNYTDPSNNIKVNGKLTLPENIADNGGLREAYRAYNHKIAARGNEVDLKYNELQYKEDCHNPLPGNGGRLPGLQQYTNEQLFFLGFASTWCDFGRSAQATATNDKHAPSRFRVIGCLSNMEEFAKAWSCPDGSPMNPKKKCVLW